MRVCAQPTFIADYGICIRGATIRFVKDGEYQNERSIGARPFPYTVSYRTANIERRYEEYG